MGGLTERYATQATDGCPSTDPCQRMIPDMNDTHKKPRRILLAVTGLTPQVVTETLYALARHDKCWIPNEIHLITTAMGADNARLNLLSGNGWFHRLRNDYALPAIDFPQNNIHVLTDASGAALEDIRTPEQNNLAADFITDTVRRLTEDLDSELHVSIAGGRKTMGYYLGYALSLYGRPQDRLSHVLVSEPYETNREFYYPTPYDHPIHTRQGGKEVTVNARNARVDLANIPFVRLRDGLPRHLLDGKTSFSTAVTAAQCTNRRVELVIDTERRKAGASGIDLKLTPQNFALLVWMAQRRRNGDGPVQCGKAPNEAAAKEYLKICRSLFGAHTGDTEKAERALCNGMTSDWFSPAKNRLHKALTHALGEIGSQAYRIHPVGGRSAAQFEMMLSPEAILFTKMTP